MLLILIVCVLKIIEMTNKQKKLKESPVLNGHFRNCLNSSRLNEGNNIVRGMTDDSNHRIKLHQYSLFPTKDRQSPKLKDTSLRKHSTSPSIGHPHNHPDTKCNDISYKGNTTQLLDNALQNTKLTDSNLQANVQIVLNNLNRNYYAIKKYVLNEKIYSNSNYYRQSNNCHLSEYWNNNVCKGMTENKMPFISPYSNETSMDSCDYQWFLESFREGITHPSVLSSLSTSYNELCYYDDLAKDIDANLAEVDMDNFHPGKINHMLTLEQLCNKTKIQRCDADLDNSICKSEQLFSPVKESHISIDSLDMDGYQDDDIILTCQANKNNYTIAFEGSTMYSDESFYDEDLKLDIKKTEAILKKTAQESSMSHSDTGFTTWSKLKEHNSAQLIRYPSGNNNNSVNITRFLPHCQVHKSSSLPNLLLKKQQQSCLIYEQKSHNLLNVSQAMSNSSVDAYSKTPHLLPMYPMPISSTECENPSGVQYNNNSPSPASTEEPKRSLNLVKLFIKQKSNSTDTCMDVSSGCWPSESSSSGEQKQRKRSMNDSGKGSAHSKNEKESDDFQYDSLDISTNVAETSRKAELNDYYRDVFDSPSHRNYNEYSLNIRNHPKRLFNVNNNNSIDKDSIKETNKSSSDATSENVTQIYFNQSTKIPINMITRSMQTSLRQMDKVNVISPSFLAQLNSFGEKQRAPVYVIYPNYSLPDLDFVETHQSDIVLSPLGYREEGKVAKKRLTTFHTTESLKRNSEYDHIVDWKSLLTLLPIEYLKLLKHIPEVANADSCINSQKPLFCMSPPLRRIRPASCDCASYVNSSSESSQPPSSGYRGSSTLLTDSEFGDTPQEKNSARQTELSELTSVLPPSGRNAPKSILRQGKRNKRYSMFEQHTQLPAAVENGSDKRRSLQDLPYTYSSDMTPLVEDTKQRNIRLSEKKTFNTSSTQKLAEQDREARARAEYYLYNVPRAELKYYAEIANILEAVDFNEKPYDRNKLRSEVSKALSQKRVSFDKNHEAIANINNFSTLCPVSGKKFTTPPNSPNISIAIGRDNQNEGELEKQKQEKIQRNRFKRLQIQFELMSKGECELREELVATETQSGGTTPTSSNNTLRSRIPRPVSYPAIPRPKTSDGCCAGAIKASRSPIKNVTPIKKSNITCAPTLTPRSRTPNKLYNTPKKTVPSPRLTTRTR